MGIDCKLFTEKGIEDLDRFYCFQPAIEEEVVYGYRDCMRLLIDLMRGTDAGDDYRRHWLLVAMDNLGEKNVFLTETSVFWERVTERIERGESPSEIIDDIDDLRRCEWNVMPESPSEIIDDIDDLRRCEWNVMPESPSEIIDDIAHLL